MLPFRKFAFGKKAIVPKFKTYLSLCQKTFSNKGSTGEGYTTMGEVKETIVKVLSQEYPMDLKHKIKNAFQGPQNQAELPVRKMKDSFAQAIVPLSTNLRLRERYSTFLGDVRVGRLMEDLDMFAVWCCVKHLSEPGEIGKFPVPYTVVTIRVDQIVFEDSFHKSDCDIRLSGHVCWVGKSSFDVVVWIDQELKGEWKRVMKALLLFAVRNRVNFSAGLANPLVAETEEEKAMIKAGEERKLKRMVVKEKSLLKKVPTEAEHNLVHDLFIKTIDSQEIFLDKRNLPPNSRWMHNAMLDNLVFCHHEYRNTNNKIFGGFLMRQAVELSWSLAFIYGMRVPRLVHISDIAFHSPVEVGSLLQLRSSVTYAQDKYIQVFVYAESYSTTSASQKSTNSFYFTYDLGKPCDKLYPTTYLEAMKYIDGRRHFQEFLTPQTV